MEPLTLIAPKSRQVIQPQAAAPDAKDAVRLIRLAPASNWEGSALPKTLLWRFSQGSTGNFEMSLAVEQLQLFRIADQPWIMLLSAALDHAWALHQGRDCFKIGAPSPYQAKFEDYYDSGVFLHEDHYHDTLVERLAGVLFRERFADSWSVLEPPKHGRLDSGAGGTRETVIVAYEGSETARCAECQRNRDRVFGTSDAQ